MAAEKLRIRVKDKAGQVKKGGEDTTTLSGSFLEQTKRNKMPISQGSRYSTKG